MPLENETVPEQAAGQGEDAVLAEIGTLIQSARTRALMTQAMLADQLGTTQAAVSRWESGERDPGVTGLLRIAEAVRASASSLLPVEHRGQPPALPGGGQFMEMSFMGFAEVTGYVTDITIGGEPGFHIDLPDKLWGGNPLSWEEWSAKALRSRHPLSEESVHAAWESERRAAEERARREAKWARVQEQRALTAGSDDEDEVPDGCLCEPGVYTCEECRDAGRF